MVFKRSTGTVTAARPTGTGLNRVLEGLKLLERDALGGSARAVMAGCGWKISRWTSGMQACFDAIVRLDPNQPTALAGV